MEFAIMNTLFKGRAKAGKVKRTEMIQPDNLSKHELSIYYQRNQYK